MGFSQGSMITLCYAMAFPNSIKGVIAQSGAIPSDFGLEIDKDGLKGKPIVITHGVEDEMMPIERGRQTRDILLELGVDVDYNEFHMGHNISEESLTKVIKWMATQL